MSQKIKHWYPKDQRFFHVLAISGNISRDDANKLNISDSRLKNLKQDGYIKEISYPSSKHQQVESNRCYTFTDKGKQFVKDKYDIQRTQNPSAHEHNCRVAHELCQLSNKEIDSAKPEWEIRQDLWESRLNELEQTERDYWEEKMQLGELSPCDVVYTNTDGVVCGIEVVTSNYGSEEIQAKEESGTFMGIDIQYVSVKG